MEPFVEQLAALCREQVTRAKCTVGERIALGGTNWLDLCFVTPLDIALRMGAPFLVERAIEPSEEGLGPALMMRRLLDLSAEQQYFRLLANQPTMAHALWATLRELRMAGLSAADLTPESYYSLEVREGALEVRAFVGEAQAAPYD